MFYTGKEGRNVNGKVDLFFNFSNTGGFRRLIKPNFTSGKFPQPPPIALWTYGG